MVARHTKNAFMDHEWEFDTYDEMMEAAKKEAVVCGDDLNESQDKKSVEIWNYHQSSVRWKGCLADIEDLRKELRRHDYMYYKLAAPEIEDYDYDMLFKRLQKMEEADPSLVTEVSPTQCVGGKSAEIHMLQNGITIEWKGD